MPVLLVNRLTASQSNSRLNEAFQKLSFELRRVARQALL